MSSQGTVRLKVTNSAPSIEKLWNNRYRLEFLCDNSSPKEDWYYDNIKSILPDYGILQEANFGSGVSEDWEAIPGSVYPNMRLVATEYLYISSINDKRVKLTYETLTASWVEEKAEDADYELNGLKRVSRTFVALPDATYDKIVGTSTIDSNGTTLYLGSFKIEKTDAKWSLSEVWVEPGILSVSTDRTDANDTRIAEAFAMQEGETKTELGILFSGFALCEKTESNYEGIKTTKFVWKKSITYDVIDYDLNGLMRLTRTQRRVSSAPAIYGQEVGVSSITVDFKVLYLASFKSVDSTLIEENYVWMEPGIVDETTRSIDDGLIQIERLSFKDENIPELGVVVSKKKQNYNGYPVWATTTIQLRDGTDPTSKVASEYSTFVPFTYPGVADTVSNTVQSGSFFYGGTWTSIAYDVKLQPPTTAIIEAKEIITYQTDSIIGALDYPLWSPKKWASVESNWSWVADNSYVNQGSESISGISKIGSKYQGLPGYRSGESPEVIYNAQGGNSIIVATFFGQNVVPALGGRWKGYGKINIIGGPENPEGGTYTIQNPVFEEAFSDLDGIQYYKKTIIVATIPSQEIA